MFVNFEQEDINSVVHLTWLQSAQTWMSCSDQQEHSSQYRESSPKADSVHPRINIERGAHWKCLSSSFAKNFGF